MKFLLHRYIQLLLDIFFFCIYRKKVVGQNKYLWCTIPVPESYPQQSQTHPSIIYLKQGWNGATHWLGTTPYPKAQVKYENPCIYYADVQNNSVPTQFIPIKNNPILEWPGGDCFNSDIELYFEDNVLYSIIREYDNKTLSKKLKVQYSTDGQFWSTPRLFLRQQIRSKNYYLLLSFVIMTNFVFIV